MNPLDVYTRSGRFTERGDVVADHAVDPVTGLPVLLYRFPGAPVADAATIDSDDVWRVLEHGADDEGGFLVSNVVLGATSIGDRPAALDDAVAERAFTAVAAASAAGVAHGDLGAHRVYRRGSQVWLEGYGVPWAAATTTDDARSLARSLLALPGHALSRGARAALERAAGDGDATTAAVALRELVAAARRDDATGASDPRDALDAVDTARVDAPPRPQRNAAPAAFAHVRIDARTSDAAGTPSAALWPPSPRSHATGSPVTPDLSVATPTPPTGSDRSGSAPRFSKDLPPDVTYRAGDETLLSSDVPKRSAAAAIVRDRRRLGLAGLLVLAAVALALVSVFGQRNEPPGSQSVGAGGSFVVDVRVTPDRLPPVSLVVVASPPGSQHAAGTVIRTVPDKVVLDREGSWQLQGRFDGRRSEIVTVVVPTDQVIVLPFADTP